MHCMCWVPVSFTYGHMFYDETFVPFKVFQKHGSSLVLTSLVLIFFKDGQWHPLTTLP